MCGTTEKSSTDRHTVWVAFKPATGLDGWKRRKIHLVEANSVQGHVHTVILLLVWFGNTEKNQRDDRNLIQDERMTVCLTHRWDRCVTHTHSLLSSAFSLHPFIVSEQLSERERLETVHRGSIVSQSYHLELCIWVLSVFDINYISHRSEIAPGQDMYICFQQAWKCCPCGCRKVTVWFEIRDAGRYHIYNLIECKLCIQTFLSK